MTKVFDHAVIYNGVFYPAHTEIEVKEEEKPAETEAVEPAETEAVEPAETEAVEPAETEAVEKPAKKKAKGDDNA